MLTDYAQSAASTGFLMLLAYLAGAASLRAFQWWKARKDKAAAAAEQQQ